MGEEALNSINRELSQLHNTETQGFIYRVHEPLRKVNSKAYEPDILAIGPYHGDKDSCKAMEEHKLRYFQLLLKRQKDITAETYISAIAKLEVKARNCYAEPINLTQGEFIKMLVLDGCFIIELVRKFEKRDYTCLNDPIFKMKWICSNLRRDLILFENQIPYFVLCELFDLIEGPDQRDRLFEQLLSFCKILCPDISYKKQNNSSLHNIKHVLDLIYSWWIPESFDGAINLSEACPLRQNRESMLIHSAAELEAHNVKFRKRDSCDSLFEVKFENGFVRIPPFPIGDFTECFLRNLIAYEQYFPDVRYSHVRDYVKFMNLLINSSKDVVVLSKYGIIDNWLGDNDVIADAVNKLNDSVTGSWETVYGTTFKDINTYYNKRRNRWKAVLNREYLSSPWRCISLLAAFLLLLLTIIQAVCSILQVKHDKAQ